ncbi:MAG: deoxyribonuclease IV [Verrucomicrobia bacterium]|nr:deoxyribonuclease IV [Verrucomicrobiota bacterium]
MRLGAHMPTAGGVWKALQRGADVGCEIVQIFVKNNMQWFGRPLRPDELAKYRHELGRSSFSCVFGHTGYLINLAAPPSAKRDKSIQSLLQEIELATTLGLPFLVMHPGSHLDKGADKGLKRVVAGLDEVFRATRKSRVRIALEVTAGQGSCLGHRLGHLADIYARVNQPARLGVCLDTAHLFAAGYDLRAPQGWNAITGEIESLIGLREILACHLNDSKTELGSRVDRHAGIGQGKIGREAFRHIVNDPRFLELPGCLETPKSPDLHEDIENLAVLRELRKTNGSAQDPDCERKKTIATSRGS